MQAAICLLSVIPMRKEPSHRSEMVSQLLFGEYVTVGEEKDDFVFAECMYDGYTGWVQKNQLTPVNEMLPTNIYVGCWADEVLVNGWCKNIPMGCPVYKANDGAVHFGSIEVRYLLSPGCLWNSIEHSLPLKEELEKIYNRFLHTPYLWGGKSVFGTDCSGFVQQVFKMFGIKLLRDAYLQAEQGTKVGCLEEARSGDLAFFQNEKGKVIHVGIILENHQIVHASGSVRLDRIDEEGIINSEIGKRTHRLHSIKRMQ